MQAKLENMISYGRAPLRLGLAGGGSDVDPFCSEFGGRVLNTTISKYVFAEIRSQSDSTLFRSLDQQVSIEYESEPSGVNPLPLHRNAYEYFADTFLQGSRPNLLIQTYTDAPVGSGLGTSSTLVVAIVAALGEHFAVPLSKYQVAAAAQIIERERCGFAGGRQDAYSATFGGLNFMEFEKDSNIINPLKIPKISLLTLESSLLLYHMGTSRLSAKIIEDQANAVQNKLDSSWDAMMRIRDEAKVMKNHLLLGDMDGVIRSLKGGWENKKSSSSAVSNQFIDEIYSAAISHGAQAGKVSGAGGGGFMLFFVDVSDRLKLVNCLSTFGGFSENVGFTDQGVETWTQVQKK
jgi:D-glycero-alpha-D-manno-heptose-7-phosphate kinase